MPAAADGILIPIVVGLVALLVIVVAAAAGYFYWSQVRGRNGGRRLPASWDALRGGSAGPCQPPRPWKPCCF